MTVLLVAEDGHRIAIAGIGVGRSRLDFGLLEIQEPDVGFFGHKCEVHGAIVPGECRRVRGTVGKGQQLPSLLRSCIQREDLAFVTDEERLAVGQPLCPVAEVGQS